ncbi:hypothetical protein LguiA_007587 [Lonicera macranthoides]
MKPLHNEVTTTILQKEGNFLKLKQGSGCSRDISQISSPYGNKPDTFKSNSVMGSCQCWWRAAANIIKYGGLGLTSYLSKLYQISSIGIVATCE